MRYASGYFTNIQIHISRGRGGKLWYNLVDLDSKDVRLIWIENRFLFPLYFFIWSNWSVGKRTLVILTIFHPHSKRITHWANKISREVYFTFSEWINTTQKNIIFCWDYQKLSNTNNNELLLQGRKNYPVMCDLKEIHFPLHCFNAHACLQGSI